MPVKTFPIRRLRKLSHSARKVCVDGWQVPMLITDDNVIHLLPYTLDVGKPDQIKENFRLILGKHGPGIGKYVISREDLYCKKWQTQKIFY